MIKSSEKQKQSFFKYFKLHFWNWGKVISTECGNAAQAIILLAGDVMQYKRLIEMQSSKYSEKDEERRLLLQN